MSLIQEIKNIKSKKAELRKFGLTLGVIFGLLGGLSLWRGKPYYFYVFALSMFFLFFGFVFPNFLRPVHKAWMALALILGSIMTKIILSILFYFVITPLGLFSKLSRKDFLDLKFNKSVSSYWIPRKKVPLEKTNYEKQF